jgi:hypothetical protein
MNAEEGDTMTIWHQALELLADEAVADVSRFPDETGTERLVRIDFLDSGDYMIAGEEDDEEGEPAGYTYALYDSEGQDFSTDGDSDIDGFSDEVRRIIKSQQR